MFDSYIGLIDLGISFGEMFLSKLKTNKVAEVSAELLKVGQAFLDSLAAHKADVITKKALEAQRG
ncbi:MAG: hypothetical protein ACREQ5_06370 [Candidatus Dormibacteria bacterium]